MRRYLPLLCLLLLTFGCQEDRATEAPINITADDVAHADNVCWWIVEVAEVPKGQGLCMAFVDTVGTIESRACPDVKRGDRVKVVLSGFSEEILRYSLVVRNKAYRETIINYFRFRDGQPVEAGSHGTPGDFLMKKSNTGSCSGMNLPLEEGEMGITLRFQKEPHTCIRQDYLAD